jgi:hypothetical protein
MRRGNDFSIANFFGDKALSTVFFQSSSFSFDYSLYACGVRNYLSALLYLLADDLTLQHELHITFVFLILSGRPPNKTAGKKF